MKAWWTSWWGLQSGRINALSLRERVFLFLSIMACCAALADAFWLSPAQMAHKQLAQRFQAQKAELQRVRDELKTVAKPVEADKTTRVQIAAVKARINLVDENIKEILPEAGTATPLAQVLTHLLRRHAGLMLVRTATLASQATAQNGGTGAGNNANAGALPPGLTSQGVELTVSGSYPDLTQYVQTLENEMPQVRWGSMKLKSDKLPVVLTLQLFLLGVQP